MVRTAIEQLYSGLVDITNKNSYLDPISKQTKTENVLVVTAQPCRLSFQNISTAPPTTGGAPVAQVIKLFLAPEIEVKAGSRCVVTQNGKTAAYKASGEPAVYSNHQEILLELVGDYA